MTGRPEHRSSLFILILWFLVAVYVLWGPADRLVLSTVMMGSFIVNSALKALFRQQRPAPIDESTERFYVGVQRLSFPSCHVQLAFTVLALVGGVASGISLPVLVLAVATGIQRLLLGRHRPRDVVAGAVIGYGLGWGSVYLWGG